MVDSKSSECSAQDSSFNVPCPLSGDVAENSIEESSDESFCRLPAFIATASVQDSVLSFLVSVTDARAPAAIMFSFICSFVIGSGFLLKLGIWNSDSNVLLREVL